MGEVYNRWMEANGGAIVNIIADICMAGPSSPIRGSARRHADADRNRGVRMVRLGVRVNAVAPGGIVSSGLIYTPEMQKKLHDFTAGVPLQRFGTEAEISAAIVYLLSPAAYVTGSCIRVDGGTPNARTTWKLEPHNRNAPFEGFHRSKLPDALKKAP